MSNDKKSKKKVIIVVISTILGIFLVWNILWIMHYANLKSYVKNIPVDTEGVYVTNDVEENSYSVKLPDYLCFNGNLALIDKDDNALIIWVSLFDDKEYGVQIYLENAENYEMLLDENGNLLEKGNVENAEEVYESNEEIIDKLYESANDFWKLK